MRFDLKIGQIGLILVVVPLIFELLFVSVLTYSVRQAEHEIKRQELAKDIVYCASACGNYATQAVVNVGGYSVSRTEYFKNLFEENEIRLANGFDKLESLLAREPTALTTAQEARSAAKDGLKLLHELVESIDRGYGSRDVMLNHGRLATVKRIIDRLHLKLKTITRDQLATSADSPAREAEYRRLTEIYLVVGVVANILIALALAFFFARSIVGKINCISQNAERVPKGLPLSKPLIGSDEITHLDHVFHSMVDELDSSKKMQQYLIAMVSHDLRSPLTSLQGILALLSNGAMGELPERAQKKVEMAEGDLVRLIKLTNDLLDTERLASGLLELECMRCLLSDIIEEALASVATFAQQHQVTVLADDSSDNDTMNRMIYMDPERIGQVLTNLLTNAIKYSPEGGTVHVSASMPPRRSEVEFVKVSIMDHGRGVPREFQKSIFEKFQQVQESDSRLLGGKGLGLAICKSIVEQHGGRIGVFSEPGDGSIFWFEIPLKVRETK